jgi:hypothetical protein
MDVFRRKGKVEQLLSTAEDRRMLRSLGRSALELALAAARSAPQPDDGGARKVLGEVGQQGRHVTVPLQKARKPGLVVAAALAGVTAASAAVSSIRKRASAGTERTA